MIKLEVRADKILIEDYLTEDERNQYPTLVNWKRVRFFTEEEGSSEEILSILVRPSLDEAIKIEGQGDPGHRLIPTPAPQLEMDVDVVYDRFGHTSDV